MKGIAVGSDGNIWFTNWDALGDFIGRITPTGIVTEFPLSFGTDPYGITSGPDGNLWFVAYGSNTIDVMSTSGSLLHQYSVAVASGGGGLGLLEDITVASDHNLYFTAQTGYIGEITTGGLVTETPVSTTVTTVPDSSGPQPLAITSGPDGNIWFTDPWTDSIGVLRIAATPTPSPVTMYDATYIAGASNGALVTTLTDLSGNRNNAIKSSSAAAVGTYVTDGIGGLPSIQFTSNGFISGDGTGYQSVLNMGTALGISGDAPWTAIYVFRAAAPSQGDYSWVGSLGSGSTANAGALVEIDAVHPINGQSPHLDLATGFSDDAVLEPGNSYDQLAGKDLVLTVIHQGPGAGSIGNTIQMFVNGDSPGQGVLSGLTLGTTGDAAAAALNLANEPFFLGGSPFGTGAGFNGLLSEALVYNTALTTTERSVIESQLMTKFGIASVPEPTSLALIASTATASFGQSVTFTATVSDLASGGATPNGGTVTFSDQARAIGTAAVVDGVAEFATMSLPAGTDTINASYSGTADFAPSATGTITPGVTVTIGQAIPTITWTSPLQVVYGTAIGATELDAVASVPGQWIYTPTEGTVLGAGDNQTLSVIFIPTDNTDYTSTTSTVPINVGQAAPQVSPEPINLSYGTAIDNGQLSGTAAWIVGGISVAVPGSWSYTSADGDVLDAGSGQSEWVTFTPTDTTDYAIATTTVIINVAQAVPVASANPVNIAYGTALANNQLSGTANWTVGGNVVGVPGSWSYRSAAGTVLGRGLGQSESVTFTPTDTTDYAVVAANVMVNVDAAPLTITAENQTKNYGSIFSFAGTEFTVIGLVNGNAVASVTLTSTGAAAAAGVSASPYAIIPSAAVGTGLNNYSITYKNGNITLDPAPLTITAIGETEKYGSTFTFVGTEFTVNGLVNSDAVTSVILTSSGAAADAGVPASPYPIIPSAAVGTGLGNYSISYNDGRLMVNRCPVNN